MKSGWAETVKKTASGYGFEALGAESSTPTVSWQEYSNMECPLPPTLS